MKITEIKTYLMQAAKGDDAWSQRNWLFVKVITDDGIYGVGEASGWPRVVETAIRDLSAILIGDDPFRIERICQKIMTAMMGHGMTGVVGSGAMTGIEMALWDLKGKALGVPVYELFGGTIRDEVKLYAHAGTPERNQELVSMGYGALKTGGTDGLPGKVASLRAALGPDVDLMVDVHGPPWLTTRDAIALGQRLEEYDLLFYEDPVAPENIEGIRRVAESVNIPIGVGERHPYLWGVRQLLEEEIADVIQPDTGRAGGLLQLKKIAALAEAHYALIAPHDGSLGPVAEMGAAHVLATVPNFLLLEHLVDDVPARYEVMEPQPRIVSGSILLSDAPGLGVDIVEDAIAKYPSTGNVSALAEEHDHLYVAPRLRRARFLQ